WLERVILDSFRPEGDFGQTTSVAGHRIDRSRTVAAGNPLWTHVLALSVTGNKGPNRVHHLSCVRPKHSPQVTRLEPRTPVSPKAKMGRYWPDDWFRVWEKRLQ